MPLQRRGAGRQPVLVVLACDCQRCPARMENRQFCVPGVRKEEINRMPGNFLDRFGRNDMDCLNHSCPFRVNETSNPHSCECVACPNRCNNDRVVISNRTLSVETLTTMDYRTTVRAVKALKVERGSLSCLGCGYEDNCTLHGCAILRNAADHMEAALANHDHLTARLDQTEAALNAATARAEQAERERDAAIADLKEIGDCEYCSGKCSNLETEYCRDCSDIGCQCRTCAGCSNWAWRGRSC